MKCPQCQHECDELAAMGVCRVCVGRAHDSARVVEEERRRPFACEPDEDGIYHDDHEDVEWEGGPREPFIG